jgi:hypothetical protein
MLIKKQNFYRESKKSLLGVVSRLRRPKSKAPALRIWNPAREITLYRFEKPQAWTLASIPA